MKKIMLATLVALMSSQSFAATLTSQGSATTTMTLNAPAGWSITKGVEGEGTLGAGNKYTSDSILNQVPTLIIKNETTTAGTYYIRGAGNSNPDDGRGTILFVKRDDTSKKFWSEDFYNGFTYEQDGNVWKSDSPLAAGGEKTISLAGPGTETTIEPGIYDVSVELLTEIP
ncbi:hypothetical protein [Serratia ficaria]|uniref:hypothetical protein n=1 Tax=Serratia ficaria TaxID=61651 RepID=UPI002179CEB9|nr:hypothetical protein [Serratia ficaria]CAI1507169.1 Uncharacterised protein [Serratia ficaria]